MGLTLSRSTPVLLAATDGLDARVEHPQEHPLHGQLHAVVVPSLPGLVPLSIRILECTHLYLVLPRNRSLTDLAAEAADVLTALAGRRLVPSTEHLLMDLEAYFLASRRLTTPLPLTHASRCPR